MNTFDAITTRYCCRAYDGEGLSDEQIQKLILAANAAPAASNNYTGHKLTVIHSPELLAEIDSATAHGIPQLGEHPTFNAGALFILSAKPNEQFPFIPYCNVACAAENIMIMARDMGLASAFLMGITMPMQKNPDLLAKLRITDGFVPMVAMPVGHEARPVDVKKPSRLKVEVL